MTDLGSGRVLARFSLSAAAAEQYRVDAVVSDAGGVVATAQLAVKPNPVTRPICTPPVPR